MSDLARPALTHRERCFDELLNSILSIITTSHEQSTKEITRLIPFCEQLQHDVKMQILNVDILCECPQLPSSHWQWAENKSEIKKGSRNGEGNVKFYRMLCIEN
jgi:hypothetical protein